MCVKAILVLCCNACMYTWQRFVRLVPTLYLFFIPFSPPLSLEPSKKRLLAMTCLYQTSMAESFAGFVVFLPSPLSFLSLFPFLKPVFNLSVTSFILPLSTSLPHGYLKTLPSPLSFLSLFLFLKPVFNLSLTWFILPLSTSLPHGYLKTRVTGF